MTTFLRIELPDRYNGLQVATPYPVTVAGVFAAPPGLRDRPERIDIGTCDLRAASWLHAGPLGSVLLDMRLKLGGWSAIWPDARAVAADIDRHRRPQRPQSDDPNGAGW